MISASSGASAGREAKSAPIARASGAKSLSIASSCARRSRRRAAHRSIPAIAAAPSPSHRIGHSPGRLAAPCGTSTSATALSSAPAPKAMTLWRSSVSSQRGEIAS